MPSPFTFFSNKNLSLFSIVSIISIIFLAQSVYGIGVTIGESTGDIGVVIYYPEEDSQIIVSGNSSGINQSFADERYVKRFGDNMTGSLEMIGASTIYKKFDGTTFGSIGAVGSVLRVSTNSSFAFSGFQNETQLAFNDLSNNISTFFNSLNRVNALFIKGDSGAVTINSTLTVVDSITAPNICYSDGTNCAGSPTTIPVFYKFETDFMSNIFSIVAPFGGSSVSSGTLTNGNGEVNHFGVAQFRDSTTANGGYRVTTDPTALLINGTENFTAIFKPIQRNNQTTIYMGMHDAVSATAPVDGCYFQINNLTLGATCTNNSVRAWSQTNLSMRNGTWYTAQIIVNPTASNVNFTVWNSTGQVYNVNVSSRIPTTQTSFTGAGIVATESTVSAAAQLFEADYMSLTINRSVNRLS